MQSNSDFMTSSMLLQGPLGLMSQWIVPTLPFANDLVESLLSALVHASAASLSVWPNSLFLSGLSLDSLWHISPAQSHVSVW